MVDAKAALKRIGKVRMAAEAKLLQTKTAKVKGSSTETETWKKNLTATSQWSEVNAAAGVLMQMNGGQLDKDLKDIKMCLTVYKQVGKKYEIETDDEATKDAMFLMQEGYILLAEGLLVNTLRKRDEGVDVKRRLQANFRMLTSWSVDPCRLCTAEGLTA